MATLGQVMSLSNWTKTRDPSRKAHKIAELLEKSTPIVGDMVFKEGNLPTGDRQAIRVALPTSYFRSVNGTTRVSTSAVAQVQEHTAILQAFSKVDPKLASLDGDAAVTRANEASAFLQSMSQKLAETVFYGSSSNPEEFVGLSNRYNSTSATNGQNIISAGGSGSDNSSIWLVSWSENGVYGIFPKGSKAGIEHTYHGIKSHESTDGSGYETMKTYHLDEWSWHCGLMVKDWRYAVRIPNIDISDLKSAANTQATSASTFLPDLMMKALMALPEIATSGKVRFYCNRTVAANLMTLARKAQTNVLSIESGLKSMGDSIFNLKFMDVPIRLSDSLVLNESAVS